MADREEERVPLLQDTGDTEPPPQYTPYSNGQPPPQPSALPTQQVIVPPIGPDELPPPYTPVPGMPLSINCKVCQAIVNIDGKQNQNVVKCTFCREATPIKAAPPGKKYVRCPCNCLLICRATAQKIACPRANCKRIITLGAPGVITSATVRAPNTNRVQCVYCNEIFLFAVTRTALARCSNCNRVSAVESSFIRTRCIIYAILGLVFLGAGIGVTVGTYELAADSGGIYTVWVGAFVIGVLFLVRATYMGMIRTSTVIGPAV
ncbi:type 2 phosphatidylinositol 4,5-bisphosphate 4-phosphatase-like [Ruditapes philippinarum]|uniref:type 2 phosphatidylinositol 4,5-bisphosphate 4-phosphatase-like n=1 Tax=Ruditapes philippinarum TaxID=129788 RepID=UPI00295BEB35|nr:type 2 phosphatidylinositol 4,5-bisphosphate 4-phosphatase-like [Ruditapes philippinarum]